MLASEALTIWMLSTAMNAPSVAPITASQVLVETAGAAAAGRPSPAGTASMVVCNEVMVLSPLARQDQLIQLRGSTLREASFFSASRSATTAALVLIVG